MSKQTNPVWDEIVECMPADAGRRLRYMKRELESMNNPGLWRDMNVHDVAVARLMLKRWVAENEGEEEL